MISKRATNVAEFDIYPIGLGRFHLYHQMLQLEILQSAKTEGGSYRADWKRW